MNTIPTEFQITNLLHQDTYLVDGQLKKWTGETSEVYSTISSTEKYAPTLLGTIPTMGESAAAEVVAAAVAAYDKGQGIWPALWMLGENFSEVGWPKCGEIDIMEHVGYDPDTLVGPIHTQSYNHVQRTQKSKKIFIKNPYTEFHVYAVDWTPEKMDFLLDGNVYLSIANEHKTVNEWPFDKPEHLLLNVAVGGNWGGAKGIDESVFPATMAVDYVRVFQ